MRELIVGVAPLFVGVFIGMLIVSFFTLSLMVMLKVLFYILDRWF